MEADNASQAEEPGSEAPTTRHASSGGQRGVAPLSEEGARGDLGGRSPPRTTLPEAEPALDPEPDPEPDPDPAEPQPQPQPEPYQPLDEDLVARVLAHVDLSEADSPHMHLAESAVWLALSNLGDRVRDDLVLLLAGDAWRCVRADRAVTDPPLQRLALGLLLQREAAAPGAGVAARAAAALAAVALGCADPRAGAGLQRGFARLRLLEITEQIPVALPIRMLALEFRHLTLPAVIPSDFVARVEDLLDRLDAQALLPVALSDHPDERSADAPGEAHLEALLQTRAPSLRSLARVLFAVPTPFASAEALLAVLREDAPASWDLPAEEGAHALALRYASLSERLVDTPFALLSPESGSGFGVSS